MKLQHTPNQLSRRNWLRDAAIAATGAAVLPSLLTSCSDHKIPPGVGAPIEEPTTEDLQKAAENLIRMRLWYDNLHSSLNAPYIFTVYTLLKGGNTPPTNWSVLIVDAFTTIGIKLFQAATAEIPFIRAAFALGVEQVKAWASQEKTVHGVDATIADFSAGYGNMHDVVSNKLLLMASNGDNYKNLRDAFKEGTIPFNGKRYTLKDLAQQHFPAGDDPVDTAQYEALREAAYVRFKRHLWNMMLVKCANMYYSWQFHETPAKQSPVGYARNEHYPAYPATYLRGRFNSDNSTGHIKTGGFDYYYFYFVIDGRELSPGAAKELFMDNTPGNIINTSGLFNRDYVFKQFHRERPDYWGYLDVRRDLNFYDYPNQQNNFDLQTDNYKFTGGDLN